MTGRILCGVSKTASSAWWRSRRREERSIQRALPAKISYMSAKPIALFAPARPGCGLCACKGTVTRRNIVCTPTMRPALNARTKKNAPSRNTVKFYAQDTLDVVDARTRDNKQVYRKRQEIVEHPFGTIKAVWGFRQFLCRRKPKVTGETSLTFLAYGLRRIVTIFKENGRSVMAAFRDCIFFV